MQETLVSFMETNLGLRSGSHTVPARLVKIKKSHTERVSQLDTTFSVGQNICLNHRQAQAAQCLEDQEKCKGSKSFYVCHQEGVMFIYKYKGFSFGFFFLVKMCEGC